MKRPAKNSKPSGKPAKKPTSRKAKARKYRPYVKREYKKSNYSLFQHYLSQYIKQHPELGVDYKKYGGFSRFAGTMWQEIKTVPIDQIESNIDIFVKDFIRKRVIDVEEFKDTYDHTEWWNASEFIFMAILNSRHVIIGDRVFFDGQGLVNDLSFDISKKQAWATKAQILHMMLKRLIQNKRIGSDDIPQVVLRDLKVDENGLWDVTFDLSVSEQAREELELGDRQTMLSDEELEKLDFDFIEKEIYDKHKQTKEEIDAERDRKNEEKRLERIKKEESSTDSNEVKLEKAKAEAEREHQRTLDKYKELGLSPDKIFELEQRRQDEETLKNLIAQGFTPNEIIQFMRKSSKPEPKSKAKSKPKKKPKK